MSMHRTLGACALASVALTNAAHANGGVEAYQFEFTGFVTDSQIQGVNIDDPVSITLFIDQHLPAIDDELRGDDGPGGGPGGGMGENGLFDGAPLIGATFGAFTFSASVGVSQTVINDSTDEYFADWDGISGPSVLDLNDNMLIANTMNLSLEGGDDPLSIGTILPSPSEMAQLATEGSGSLRFSDVVPRGSTPITPSIVFNITGGSVVPAPGAIALLGGAGIVGLRRRR